MEAMRLRLAVRTSRRVSLIWTSGSPSFSCSTSSSSPGLDTSPCELPEEFCAAPKTPQWTATSGPARKHALSMLLSFSIRASIPFA